ncbi:MAG TPA: methylated-DNA--[protein]-cysteine S-methyltransferase [Candidatus Binataceae bacterium]|nr:methylated-DNA--[protein]-cysteine S-methyltransferase [Candidatus Binataceae bacterium]
MDLSLTRIASPIGTLIAVSDGRALYALDYADFEPRMIALLRRRCGDFRLIERDDALAIRVRLRAYFAAERFDFDGLALNPGGTGFQKSVWDGLCKIPPGATVTYGELAKSLGLDARSSRAVGYANSLNPIAIIIPCHRVIGADGSLTGYAGGIERKRWLLAHERALPSPLFLRQKNIAG